MNKKLKKLQFNFTTISQSKQLMKLGVPVDTADFIIYNDIMSGDMCMLQAAPHLRRGGVKSSTFTRSSKGYENISIPAWSLGRLTEILDICYDRNRVEEYVKVLASHIGSSLSQIRTYIRVFKECIEKELIDFDKLYVSK